MGGSLGGLFAGVILKRLGHTVRILERNPTPLLHDQGAGIVAGGDTQAFFNTHDRTRRRIAVTSRLRHYLDKKGNEIHREDYAQQMTSWDLLYHLLRANFDGVDSGYCDVPREEEGDGEGKYDYGFQVTGIEDLGPQGGVKVSFKDIKTSGENESSTTADLVIAADGPSSTIRKLMEPDVERTYAGYVAWRGTVPEDEVSEEARRTFVEKFTFFHAQGLQILAYVIPGKNGSLKPGERLINWVWYCNYDEGSSEFEELMTDTDGHKHHYTLPAGKMRPAVLEKQKHHASAVLPPRFAELVRKTTHPFIQAITDVISPRAAYFDGRLLLIGDAVAGFRPHTAASTSQAAFDAMMLGEMVRGEMTLIEWTENVMGYARGMQKRGVEMGNRSQFGTHPLVDRENKSMVDFFNSSIAR